MINNLDYLYIDMSLSIVNPFNISYYISIISTIVSLIYILSQIYFVVLKIQVPLFIVNSSILIISIITLLFAGFIIKSSKGFKARYKTSKIRGRFNVIALLVFTITIIAFAVKYKSYLPFMNK